MFFYSLKNFISSGCYFGFEIYVGCFGICSFESYWIYVDCNFRVWKIVEYVWKVFNMVDDSVSFGDVVGEMWILVFRRFDGIWCKVCRVKEGYVLLDEVVKYESKGK